MAKRILFPGGPLQHIAQFPNAPAPGDLRQWQVTTQAQPGDSGRLQVDNATAPNLGRGGI